MINTYVQILLKKFGIIYLLINVTYEITFVLEIIIYMNSFDMNDLVRTIYN